MSETFLRKQRTSDARTSSYRDFHAFIKTFSSTKLSLNNARTTSILETDLNRKRSLKLHCTFSVLEPPSPKNETEVKAYVRCLRTIDNQRVLTSLSQKLEPRRS